jgi:hypothetical protein
MHPEAVQKFNRMKACKRTKKRKGKEEGSLIAPERPKTNTDDTREQIMLDVQVSTLSGDTYSVRLSPFASFQALKEELAGAAGVRVWQMQLVCTGCCFLATGNEVQRPELSPSGDDEGIELVVGGVCYFSFRSPSACIVGWAAM